MLIRDISGFKKGTVIDVRSEEEFMLMRPKNAVNIPIGLLLYSLDLLQALPQPWIFCCEEGRRSGLAVHLLQNLGFEDLYNGGAWIDIDREQLTQSYEAAA